MNKHIIAYIQLSLGMAIAGSSVIVGKILTESMPVFLISLFSLGIALPILLPVALYRYGNIIKKMQKKTFLLIFLQGMAGVFLFRIFMLYGVQLTTATAAGLITSTSPALQALLALLIFKERISARGILGILLTIAGVYLINGSTANVSATLAPNPLAGNLLLFAATIGGVLFSIFGKMLPEEMPPFLNTAIVSLFSFICFIPLALPQALKYDFASASPVVWLALIYYGIVVTIISFLLWFSGLAKVDAGKAGVFSACMPLSAFILSVFLLGEHVEILQIISFILIVCGIVLNTLPSGKNSPENLSEYSLLEQ